MFTRLETFYLLTFALTLVGCGRPSSTADGPVKNQDAPAPLRATTDWPMFRGDAAHSGVAQGELTVPLKLLWSFKTGGPVNSSAVVAEGRVFIGSGDGNVYAIDLKSGEKLWQFKTGGPVEAPPLALNGRVFAGSQDGSLYALEAATGAQVWKYTTGEKILASANWFVVRVAADVSPLHLNSGEVRADSRPLPQNKEGGSPQTNLLIGSYDYFLHCVDAVTGRSNWTYETANYINGTPAISGGKTVFGGCDAILHSVSVADGKKLGEISAGAYVTASVCIADDRAYFGHYENEFLCVDLLGGSNVWTFHDRNFPYFSSPAVTTNRVFFGGRDKMLRCVNRADGEPVWQFPTRGKVDSSPVVCGDKVIVGSDDGRLYVVSLADGKELWSYEIGQPVGSSPAVVGGKVIIGNEDGGVYCFGNP